MVMMQSPVSDIPPTASPRSSTPNSPNNNSTKSNNILDSQLPKFEPIRLERPQPTKFDGILLARFHEHNDTIDAKNRPLIYPKDMSELETNATKFSIERLKQLTNNHSINRLSPSEDSNQSVGKYSLESKFNNLSPKKCVEMDISSNNLHQNNQLNYHQFPLKYPTSNPTDIDIERLKLARNMTNGKDLSDFGFRIQLGGFQSNYARSDTSEELVVDENNELTSPDNATVSEIYFIRLVEMKNE